MICMVIALLFRFQYEKKSNGYMNLQVLEEKEDIGVCKVMNEEEVVEEVYDHTDVTTFDALQTQADVIVKVRVQEGVERQMSTPLATKTKVSVEAVYKGDISKNNGIWIYEPAVFLYDKSQGYYFYETMNGYQIMQKGQEYIVFLQKLPANENYKKGEEENNTYLVFNSLYSKYPVLDGKTEALDNARLEGRKEPRYTYGEVKEQEILANSKKIIESYQKIKQQLRENGFL